MKIAVSGLRSVVTPNRLFLVRYASIRPAKAKWYHSTDVPLSKPEWYDYTPDKEAEKFVAFTDYDNARLERAFQQGLKSLDVKEDRLFLVDFAQMHLVPVFWPGPVYEVRRGTWFTADGMPLSTKATQIIEEGYRKINPAELEPQVPDFADDFAKSPMDAVAKFEKQVKRDLGESIDISMEHDVVDIADGKAVVYFDATRAAIFPREFGKFQLNVIRSLQPKSSSLMSVVPIQRGYTDDLGSSIIDKAVKIPSLTEMLLDEVLKLFSKDSLNDERPKRENPEELLQHVLESDYEHGGDVPDKREIDHLVLCIHGIGQILGYKYEQVNFTHSINVMRNTMRDVYMNEKKYQKLAYGDACDYKNKEQRANNRIQVLPISWRHNVTFHPKKPFSVTDDTGEHKLPSLSDINVDGVASLRDMVGDVLLDILLYYEPTYMNQIMKAVVTEINRVYKLYIEKNPHFRGKVHILGHSLGSAIAFDLVASQKEKRDDASEYQLDFDVANLFCVGSPVGVFKLLQRKNIVSRKDVPTDFDPRDRNGHVSSPKCENLYNVFHPCDPVAYRMEPLVDQKYSNLRAEGVPFAMEGFNTQVQSLTSLSDELSERISQASSWLKGDHGEVESAPKVSKDDALKDVISSLTTTRSRTNRTASTRSKSKMYSKQDLKQLLDLNKTGRVDYSLPQGVFSIALVSAISAHVSYFEDEETAGFVMKEILAGDVSVEERKVYLYK